MAIQTVRTLEDIKHYRHQIIALARKHHAREIAVFGSLVRGELGTDSAYYKLKAVIRGTHPKLGFAL